MSKGLFIWASTVVSLRTDPLYRDPEGRLAYTISSQSLAMPTPFQSFCVIGVQVDFPKDLRMMIWASSCMTLIKTMGVPCMMTHYNFLLVLIGR